MVSCLLGFLPTQLTSPGWSVRTPTSNHLHKKKLNKRRRGKRRGKKRGKKRRGKRRSSNRLMT